ncbi:MAG: glycosyltransferase [Cycloclasticus sp. symbiont of Poecilosclerida sp. M]|nr:MAG: glycosyltransferase [Cycloclasticus sp. symbiont of Poecilosclerida sp. M]
MKVLMLVIDQQRIQLESLYQSINQNCDLDLRRLNSKEQANLARYFRKNIDLKKYQRIILFVRFKWLYRQTAFTRRLPNVVMLEHDAWQNYFPESKYAGKFSRHYKAMPWVRILVSGATLAEKLKGEGFDAQFVPKGYDQLLLKNKDEERTVELGFIGSIQHDTYCKRRLFLEQMKEEMGLFITRTESGREYLDMLNKIKFFLSADIGFGENMAKNFEAMACGCVLLAYDQGEKEAKALGFEDMVNVVLYSNSTELKEKLALLRGDSQLAIKIEKKGQELAESTFSLDIVGKRLLMQSAQILEKKV